MVNIELATYQQRRIFANTLSPRSEDTDKPMPTWKPSSKPSEAMQGQKISLIRVRTENEQGDSVRYNQAVKFIRETEFPEYNCRIIHNTNNEIEIITRNYFGKKASLEQQQQGIIRKIKRKLGEIIRELGEERSEEIKEIKELGRSNNIQSFLESEYRELYEEEAEELERLEREKANLGENEQGVSYDFARPDLAIL
ncbi:33718_t:CDS:2 [Racocetra persica]|uniref:33718_t:CDS:1 n=1 Tax=Racocetra persica TaxID=160502 RepID=A0ACA9R7F4_9GLOM|nr:33718_t:CDS:2 [Racocetra persica]